MARYRPQYRFALWFVLRWLATAALGRRRDQASDAEEALAPYSTLGVGSQHLPDAAPFILMMNHYERAGLRVWWGALLVARELHRTRPGLRPPRWLITDRFYGYRLGPLRVPDSVMRMLLRRIARVYGLILVPRPTSSARERSRALREARAALQGPEAAPVGITPEADLSSGTTLGAAWHNAGAAVAVLSEGRVPVVPVGVYEDEAGRLVARFGEPFVVEGPRSREAQARRQEREGLAARLMASLAALVPPEIRAPHERA